jgi:ketosteroid isomerase-like protein
MTKLTCALALALLTGGSSSCTASRIADPSKPEQLAVLATVQQFVEGFNAGDTAKALALCTDEMAIVDDIPPHEWHGPGALTKWLGDYGVDAKRNGITDGVVTLGKARHVDVSGACAYAVIPSDYTFKRNGEKVEEHGSLFTFALHKNATAWLISGWAWAKN